MHIFPLFYAVQLMNYDYESVSQSWPRRSLKNVTSDTVHFFSTCVFFLFNINIYALYTLYVTDYPFFAENRRANTGFHQYFLLFQKTYFTFLYWWSYFTYNSILIYKPYRFCWCLGYFYKRWKQTNANFLTRLLDSDLYCGTSDGVILHYSIEDSSFPDKVKNENKKLNKLLMINVDIFNTFREYN